jgi:hypothetical protein
MQEARKIITELFNAKAAAQQRVGELERRASDAQHQMGDAPALPLDAEPLMSAITETFHKEGAKLLKSASLQFKTALAEALDSISTSVDERFAQQQQKIDSITTSATAIVTKNVKSLIEAVDVKVVGLAAELHEHMKSPALQQTAPAVQDQFATAMRELPERTSNLHNLVFELPSPSSANFDPSPAIITAVNAAMKESKDASIRRLRALKKDPATLATAPAFNLSTHLSGTISPLNAATKPNAYKVRVASPDIAKTILRDASFYLRRNHNIVCYEDLTYSQREYKKKLQPLFRALMQHAVRTNTKKPYWERGLIRYYRSGSTTAVDHVCNWDPSRLQQEISNLHAGASTSAAAAQHTTRSRRSAAQAAR